MRPCCRVLNSKIETMGDPHRLAQCAKVRYAKEMMPYVRNLHKYNIPQHKVVIR